MPTPPAQCLQSFGAALRERARFAARVARGPGVGDADHARAFALFEAVGLLLAEAEAAGLDADAVGMGGFDPDLDRLGPPPRLSS